MPSATARPSPSVHVVTTVPLGQHRSLHVVAVGRQQWLIGSTSQQITLLASLEDGGGRASEAERGASTRAASAAGAALEEDSWEEPATASGDRFEELLLRLRRLEAEQDPRTIPVEEARPAGRYGGRPDANPRSAAPETPGPRPRNSDAGAWDERGPSAGALLQPGSLFRTSAETRGGGRHA